MIRVAKKGYEGTYGECGPVMWIDGQLHQAIRPINSANPLWVPVRVYTGPIQHVDTRGRPVPTPDGSDAGGEGRDDG